MTNQHVRTLIEQVKKGSTLTKTEQLQVLSALLRANRRIIAARKLGYDSQVVPTDNIAIFPEIVKKTSSA
jgi:hypothetical protein